MIKNIPAPCCGTYDIAVSSRLENGKVLYTAGCPRCQLAGEECETKQEAIYEYETFCKETWKRNPNGLLDWMKKPPENEKETVLRMQIEHDVRKIFGI